MIIKTFPGDKAVLDNIQFDKKGCYSKFAFEIACKNCGTRLHFYERSCQRCGSADIKCISLSDNPHFVEQQKILDEVGDFILEELGQISVEVDHDSEGKSEASFTYHDETEDGSIQWEADVHYSREEDGSNNVKVGIKGTWEF